MPLLHPVGFGPEALHAEVLFPLSAAKVVVKFSVAPGGGGSTGGGGVIAMGVIGATVATGVAIVVGIGPVFTLPLIRPCPEKITFLPAGL